MKNEYTIQTLAELPQAANQISAVLQAHGGVIAFYGAMGVGKTTLICELCKSMGINSVVNSPTFALVNEYFKPNGDSVFHFDFYRINSLTEAYDFGYEEYFYGGSLCLCEWPEKIEPLLPEGYMSVILTENADGSRHVVVTDDLK